MWRRRRVLLLLTILVIGVGALGALTAARARSTVVRFFERQIPGQLTVSSWALQLRPGVTVVARGVALRAAPTSSKNPLFTAQRVDFRLDPVRLLLGRVRITRMSFDTPELSVEALGRAWIAEPEARARPERARGDSGSRTPGIIIADPLPLEIHHGHLTLRWGSELKTLSDVNGQLVYSQGGRRIEYRLAWTGAGDGPAEMSGFVVALGGDSFTLEARVKSSGSELVAHAAFALDQGPFHAFVLSGQVTARGQTAAPGAPVSFQGSGTGSVAVEGPLEARRVRGNVTVEDGRLGVVGHPPIEAIRGRIMWTSEGAESPAMTGQWRSATLRARLRADWSGRSPRLRGELSVSSVDLGPLLGWITKGLQDRPSPSPRTVPVVPLADAAPARAPWPAWARQIGVDLRLRVASARLNGEPLGALHAQLLAAAGLWHLQGIRLILDEGQPRGYLKLDLRSPRPRGTLFAQGPGLALFRQGLPEPYRLSGGHLTFETFLQWEGLSWPEVRQSVRGQGELRIQDGRLETARLIRHLEVVGLPRLGLEEAPFFAFHELWTRYRVAGPRVVTQTLALTGPAWEVRGEGFLQLSGRLNFRLTGYSQQNQRVTGLLDGDLEHPRLVISY